MRTHHRHAASALSRFVASVDFRRLDVAVAHPLAKREQLPLAHAGHPHGHEDRPIDVTEWLVRDVDALEQRIEMRFEGRAIGGGVDLQGSRS